MARPRDLVVRFLADVRGFLSSTQDVKDAYTEMEQAAKDTTRVGTTESQKLARAYAQAGKNTANSIDHSIKGAASKASQAGTNIGQALGQNISDGLRSGDVAGSAQNALIDIVGSLGPIGLGIGVGVAVIKGITDSIAANQAKVNKALKDSYDAAVGVLLNGDTRTLADVFNDITPDQSADLRRAGISIADYALAVQEAQKGDRTKLDGITTALNERAKALKRVHDALPANQQAYTVTQTATLGATEATLANIQATTDAINAQANAVDDLRRALNKTDIAKIAALGGSTNAQRKDSDVSGRRVP